MTTLSGQQQTFAMATFTFSPSSAVEQLARHLREEILRGSLSGEMPGINRLAGRLGVGSRTVIAAVRQLEREGMIAGQGTGRRSRIVRPENPAPAALRVRILLGEPSDAKFDFMADLRHELVEAGHISNCHSKSLRELGMDVERVARSVAQVEADAWVVLAGSHEVLEWFAKQQVPAFALAGRRRSLAMAGIGPDKVPAIGAVVRRLVELGHRRIVLLARDERRKPHPGLPERSFLGELKALGLPVGPYNLPDWEDSREDFHRCLDSLFGTTPPTALVIDDSPLFIAAQQHLARRGIVAPEAVSMICSDPDPAFDWCDPAVSHIRYDSHPWVRRIVRWANNVSRGKDDRRQSLTVAEFVEGGTIGPAP